MIQTLQKKFVVTAMIAITILLVALLGAVNLANYIMMNHHGEQLLQVLIENEGAPAMVRHSGYDSEYVPVKPPIREREAMEARYFLLRWDEEGALAYADTRHIFAVTAQEAQEYGETAMETEAAAGELEQFRYRIVRTRDNGSMAVFLDVSAQRRSILTVLMVSVVVGICCWVLMLILVNLLSRRAIRPIAENFERQKQFVTDAGHEIKTPLAIILANTEAMELHCGENKWSRNIRNQTTRLGGLMENLLILARMDEQRPKLVCEDINLSVLVREHGEPFGEGAALKNADFSVSVVPDIHIHADREQTLRIVTILMDNAVKYVNENGRIELSLRREGQGALLQVSNTCETLPDCSPEKLFDRFYRADSARTQKNGGYGIGLAVAQAIVQAHGGSIRAFYKENSTIVFSVLL